MPLYEYVCEEDGTTLELRRPMSQADDPVDDPEGRGRAFKRALSTFQARGGSASGRASSLPAAAASCPCGKPGGGCGGGF